MIDVTADAIAFEFASERLRQERETFNLNLEQSTRWFKLRLTMGYAAVLLLPLIAILTSYIILNPTLYSGTTVAAAATALLADVLGLLISIWKVVLNKDSIRRLDPVTALPSADSRRQEQSPALQG